MERYCARCVGTVNAQCEDPEMRKYVKVYFAVGLIYLPFLPIVGADIVIMIPNLVIYLFGAGAAMRYWNQPMLCDECGAETQAQAAGSP